MIQAVAVHHQPTPPLQPDEGNTSHRLGYLIKHVYLRFGQLTSAELEPLGISPLEWAALSCLDVQRGLSQKEVAELLGIDRTKMVALVDEHEATLKRFYREKDRVRLEPANSTMKPIFSSNVKVLGVVVGVVRQY